MTKGHYKRARDSQRSKLYAAERDAFGESKQELSLDECEALVKRVFESARVKEKYNPLWVRPPFVSDGRGCRRALSHGGRISLPTWARTTWVVLHEMAHEIHKAQRNGRQYFEAAHGYQFAAIELDLIRWFMGVGSHDVLKASFKKHRVRYAQPRKGRTLSPEQKDALRERLAKARGMKAARAAGDQWPELHMIDQIAGAAFTEGDA